MPNFDKTGPEGKGPLTGGGCGSCEGAKKECGGNGAGRGVGRGAGNGAGRGAGRGRQSNK